MLPQLVITMLTTLLPLLPALLSDWVLSGLPMCIVNMGETRAERMGVSVVFKSDANCAELLTAVVQGLDEWRGVHPLAYKRNLSYTTNVTCCINYLIILELLYVYICKSTTCITTCRVALTCLANYNSVSPSSSMPCVEFILFLIVWVISYFSSSQSFGSWLAG